MPYLYNKLQLKDWITAMMKAKPFRPGRFTTVLSSGPILTFAPRLGRHVCKCQNRKTTGKIKLLVELLDLTFAWMARGNWGANVKSAPTSLVVNYLASGPLPAVLR